MPNELPNDMLKELLQLPYEQRDQLANTLIDSLHPTGASISQDEWKSVWLEECHRRLSDIESGKVLMIPADNLIARMRSKHGG